MKNHTRISAMLLALLILASTVSCGGEATTTERTTSASTDTTTAAETVDTRFVDDLPNVKYDGYEFNISSQDRTWYHGNWTVEEQNGDVLNDAIYARNEAISERFDIKIVEHQVSDSNFARATILSGDDVYDIVHTNSGNSLAFAEEGLLVEVSELPHLDLSKGYYDQSINNTLTIAGKLFFPVGAADLTVYDYTHVMMFNKGIVEDMKLSNPYELVKSGDWTFEIYAGMAKTATKDINGDSKMDEKDSYGFLSQAKHVLPCFWISAGALSVNRGADGNPAFTMAKDQNFIDIFEQIFKITYDNNSWYQYTEVNNADMGLQNMFDENQALFLNSTFYYIESFRDMDTDFGIIPYPKKDADQENYYSRTEGANFISVPVTATDLERTSVIIEALNCESAKTVIPAYYDVALKTKMTRDTESAEMLDLIFNNRVFDLGDTIWCSTIRDGVFLSMFSNNDRALSSKMASMETSINEKINATVTAFSK